jgi:kynurenine 3-monooxygenase
MRTPDIEAMSDLCREHLSVLRDRVSERDFQRQWHLEQQLHVLLPDVFTPLYSMIAFSSMPYAEARRRDRHQAQVVQELLQDPDLESKLETPAPRDALCRYVRWRLSQDFTMQERECLTHVVRR